MPDLTVFCPLFSWLKDFKIPPARILQSRVLDSKVVNAFSALSLAERCTIQKFFMLSGVVSYKNSLMKAFAANFF